MHIIIDKNLEMKMLKNFQTYVIENYQLLRNRKMCYRVWINQNNK